MRNCRKLPGSSLPAWRGFNLLNKFNGQNEPFAEEDFQWLAELGFNFVRLPMDYRMWIEEGDWRGFAKRRSKRLIRPWSLAAGFMFMFA